MPSEVAHRALAILADSDYIAIDTETNGKDIRDGRGYCYGISFATDRVAFYLPFRHKEEPHQNLDIHEFSTEIQEILDTKKIIYFNALFDIVSLSTLGLDARRSPEFFCTQILSHLVDENRPFAGKSLDAVTKLYLGDQGGKRKNQEYEECLAIFGYEGLTAEATCEYAAWDAKLTYDLFITLRPKLRELGLKDVWAHKQQMILRLISMEHHGINIDEALCQRMSDIGRSQMSDIMVRLGGLNPGSPTDLEALLVKRMGLPVVKRTPKGKPCFDKHAMQKYEEEYLAPSKSKEAQLTLAYRGWQKSVTSNYEPYVRLLSPDNLLRPNYLLYGTVTGRLSCRNPNLQQIPRAGEKPWNGRMKQCFVPVSDDFALVEFDYSQLEFRLSTHFAGQKELVEVFNDPNRDIFQEIADALGKWERQDAKTLVYLLSYGGGPSKIANVFGTDYAGGKQIRDNFFSIYRNLLRASNYAQNHALREGRVRLWSGRYRNFLNRKEEAHKAYNSFIQGTAADLVERAMIRSAQFESADAWMMLQIHDSVVWSIRKDLLSILVPLIQFEMSNCGPEWSVPFKTDAHYWGGEKVNVSAAA